METHEIPADQWQEALELFSRMYQSLEVRIESQQPGAASAAQAGALPLLGVTLLGGGDKAMSIEVMAGAPSGRGHVRHVMRRPMRVLLSQWNDGASARLDIENESGEMTHVCVGPAEQTLPPGAVTDGYFERP